MGGRGAASGTSKKPYGSEYDTIHKDGNIKFVVAKNNSAKTPMETKSGSGRVYATIGSDNEVRSITYYDSKGLRTRQIDVNGRPHYIRGQPVLPHTHMGYVHDESGTRRPNNKEKKLIKRVLTSWYKYKQSH